MKGLVIVPAYNEEKVIAKVLEKIPKTVLNAILNCLIVDDGSTDRTAELVKSLGYKCISHPINRGLGAALGTGFEYARIHEYDFLITLDADGQHDPTEINNLCKPILNNQADFVIGTRIFKKGMPWERRVLTLLASVATYIFTGIWTTDSQSGFRAFSKSAIDSINIDVDRMEVSSDFFRQANEKDLRYQEVEITPIYTQYSLSKGQNAFNSVNILRKLFLKKIME